MNNQNNINPTNILSLNTPEGKSWLKQINEPSTPPTSLTVNDDGLILINGSGTIAAPWAVAFIANQMKDSSGLTIEAFGKKVGVSKRRLKDILAARNYFSRPTLKNGSSTASNPLDAFSDSDPYQKMCRYMVNRINGMEDGDEKRRLLSLFRPTNCQVSPYPDTGERLTTIQDAIPNFGPDGNSSLKDAWEGTKISNKEKELIGMAIVLYSEVQLPGCGDMTELQFMEKLTNHKKAHLSQHLKTVHGSTSRKRSQKGVPVLDADTTSDRIREIRNLAQINAMQNVLSVTNNSNVGNTNHGLGDATMRASAQSSLLERHQSIDMDAVNTALSVIAGHRIHPRTGKDGRRGELCSSGKSSFLALVGLYTMGGIHPSLADTGQKKLYSFLQEFFGECDDDKWANHLATTLCVNGSSTAPYEHHEPAGDDGSDDSEDDDTEEEWQARHDKHLKTLQEELPKAVANCKAREEAVKSKSSDTDASDSEYEETKSSNNKKKGKSKAASGSGGGKRVSSTGEPTPGRPSSSDQSDAKKSATADKSGRKPLKNVTTNQWAFLTPVVTKDEDGGLEESY